MFHSFGLDMTIVESKFKGLIDDVKLVLFSQEASCIHCWETKRLLEKLASITHKITFDTYNYTINKEAVDQYKIKRVPAVVLVGAKDYGVRYYCFPQGTELYNFIDDIVQVSQGASIVLKSFKKFFGKLKTDVQLELFISTMCPFSWSAEKTALRLALSSDKISLDIINVMDFRETAEIYHVRGIPLTVVNGKKSFYGALPDEEYISEIIKHVS